MESGFEGPNESPQHFSGNIFLEVHLIQYVEIMVGHIKLSTGH